MGSGKESASRSAGFAGVALTSRSERATPYPMRVLTALSCTLSCPYMKAITYTAAREALAATMDEVCRDRVPVVITRKAGDTFLLSYQRSAASPLDVPGIATQARTADILAAVKESRAGKARK